MEAGMCGWHVCPHFENMQVHFPPAGSGALVLCIYKAPGYLVFYSKNGQGHSTLLYFLLHGGSAPPSAWPQLVPFSTHVPHLPGAYILAFSLEGTLCPTNSEPIPQFLESQKPSFNLLTWTFTQKRDRISPRRGTNWFLPTAPRCQAEQQLYQCSGPISTLKALDQALGLSLPQFPTCKTDLSIFPPLQSSGG